MRASTPRSISFMAAVLAFGVARIPVASAQRTATAIDHTISLSDLVAVAKIVRFVEDPGASAEMHRTGNITGGISPFQNMARGTFSVAILARLKGTSSDKLDFHAPPIDGRSNYGDPDLIIGDGQFCLLYLTHQADSSWASADFSRPITPLGKGVDVEGVKSTNDANISDEIIRLLIDSLQDARVRRSATFALQQFRGKSVIAAVRPLADDPDVELQQSAQSCLAANQVVEVIPRIAELERKLRRTRASNRAVTLLRAYNDPRAVPYLNPLLIDGGSQYTRINAIAALRDLADKTSIPYLMISLNDPEPQGEVAFIAHVILHRLIPELGPPQDRGTFSSDPRIRDAEIQRAQAWLIAEVAGLHGDNPPPIRPRSMTPPIPSTQPNSRAARGPAD